MAQMIKSLLAHPLTRGLDLDDPRTTELRREIIRSKSFLRQIYQEWYTSIAKELPKSTGAIVELGSGAGFLKECVPEVVSSEVFYCAGADIVLSGLDLPFGARTLRGIVMIDVLHHLPKARRFFSEASQCIGPGGVIVMIEPWVTSWSRLIYTRVHHEPFDPETRQWEFPASGPLSGANGALPHVIFVRDRAQFEHEFPMWEIISIKPMMPFRYLVSGGVSMRSLLPGWTYPICAGMERLLQPLMNQLAMFALIVLRKRESEPE